MPFRPDPFLRRFEPLRRSRQRPVIGYSVAVAAVALAAALRLSLSPLLVGIPLFTFYPAVAAATAIGGTRPGLVGLVLSVVLANYMLHAPHLGFAFDAVSLFQTALFVLVSALIVVQIMLLNEAIERLARQADNSTAILESQTTGILAVDEKGRITLVNSAVERQLGYSREELLDQPVELLVPAELRLEHVLTRGTFMQNPVLRRMGAGRDLHALAKDGSLLPVEIGLNPVNQGGRRGALATIVDISERKNLEWRSQMLANEVQHRSRNLLTIIQALAQRMLPKADSERFADVLAAIARTHELFGTATTGSLRAIIEGELAPLRNQCDITLCDLLVTAKVGQDMTLIVHELVTNSLKYGALSRPEGRISVTADVEAGIFHLRWEERGGPAVAKPGRQGLGRTILRDLAEGFADKVLLDYAEQGFRYELSAQLDRLSNVAPLHTKASGTEG